MKSDTSSMRKEKVSLRPAQRCRRALLAGMVGSAAGMLLLLAPGNIPLPSCTFHELTGYSCLTCGLTRSLLAIAHGQFSASLGHHLMGPVLCLGTLLAVLRLGTEAFTGRRWNLGTTAGFWRSAVVFLALAWITYGGIRLALEITG